MCITSADCNSHGDCFSTICYCDAGWFEADCSVNLKTDYKEAFYFYIVFFVVTFSFIALHSIKGINDSFRERKINDYRRYAKYFEFKRMLIFFWDHLKSLKCLHNDDTYFLYC